MNDETNGLHQPGGNLGPPLVWVFCRSSSTLLIIQMFEIPEPARHGEGAEPRCRKKCTQVITGKEMQVEMRTHRRKSFMQQHTLSKNILICRIVQNDQHLISVFVFYCIYPLVMLASGGTCGLCRIVLVPGRTFIHPQISCQSPQCKARAG